MLGEAIGWRGGRFSGIPFTSEAQIAAKMLPFTGLPTSRRDRPYKESTATVFWDVMYPYFPNFLAWNCIPLHPYQPELPLSNRTPTTKEQSEFLPLLSEFITILAPKNIIAIGRKAQTALLKLGLSHHTVRHPSHGGAREFIMGINSVMSQLDRD